MNKVFIGFLIALAIVAFPIIVWDKSLFEVLGLENNSIVSTIFIIIAIVGGGWTLVRLLLMAYFGIESLIKKK